MRKSAHSAFAFLTLAMVAGCNGDQDPTGPAGSSGPPTEGLRAHLTFNGNTNDQSGNGSDGTLLGGATLSSGALVLGDNATDMLTLPGAVLDGLGDFTFAAWLRIDVLRDESHEILSGANPSEDNALIFWYSEPDEKWWMGVNDVWSEFAQDARIEDGQWHHVAVTRSGSSAALYLDGSQVGGAITVPNDVLNIDAAGLVFGQDQDSVAGGFAAGESWAGAMDNLRIYDRALSGDEVQTLAQESH